MTPEQYECFILFIQMQQFIKLSLKWYLTLKKVCKHFLKGPKLYVHMLPFLCSICFILWFPGLSAVNLPMHSFQLKKLGVMPPEQPLPVKCNRIYQIMWANNGDSISRQYAGTAALKVSVYSQHLGDAGCGLKPTWFLRKKHVGFRWQVYIVDSGMFG